MDRDSCYTPWGTNMINTMAPMSTIREAKQNEITFITHILTKSFVFLFVKHL